MKKLLLVVSIAFLGITSTNAQEMGFGAKAGLSNVSFSEGDVSETGFFIGLTGEFELTEAVAIQPEVLYSAVSDLNMLSVPIMAKYFVADGISLQAGPQLNYVLDDVDEDFNSLGVGLAIGAGYEITETIFADVRYGFELTNRYGGDEDVSVGLNTLMVGVGYRF